MNTFQAGDQVTHLSRSDGRGRVVGSGDEGYVWVNWPNRIGSQHERIDYLKHAEHEPHVGLRKVHDHSPEERHGLDCAEFAHPDGRPVGACIVNAEHLKYAEPAPTIHDATMNALHKKWDADRNKGEVRTTSSTGGQKGVKPEMFSLIPAKAWETVARHYGVGAAKYDRDQWRKGYEWPKSYDAAIRHLSAFWGGEDLDPETETPHPAAVVFHMLTLLTFMDEHPGHDDRYKPCAG